MGLGFVGGALLVGSGLALAISPVVAWAGGTAVIGGAALAGSLVLGGAGAALVAIGGPPLLDGLAARAGLAILALGQLVVIAALLLHGSGVGPVGGTSFAGLAGVVSLAPSVGMLVIGTSLVRRSGQAGVVGALLLASVALLVLLPIADAFGSPGLPWQAVSIIGDGIIVVGVVGLGLLASRGDRPTTLGAT